MSLVCPFARSSSGKSSNKSKIECKKENQPSDDAKQDKELASPRENPVPKCPFGYDSTSFKLGPLSCVLCRALLFESTKCVPCGHLFCRFCISRFNDCPLCGAGIDTFEPDNGLQKEVDQFIEGHARIKRSIPLSSDSGGEEEEIQKSNVTYEDVSLERGTFLVQQAMRAFQAQNLESASARLGMCANDIREELVRSGATPEVCSQLGAVLGMLGDCSRSMGDSDCAMEYYNESAEMLLSLSDKDVEVVHALSVSLNKMGDLKYYANDLQSARTYYARALNVRKDALVDFTQLSSQVLDVAVSLAKVADVDRALGDSGPAKEGFQEAVKMLQNLSISSNVTDSLERRRLSILEFVDSQVKEGV